MIIRFLSVSEAEFMTAARFYEAADPGLGNRFIGEIIKSIGYLKLNPHAGRIAGKRVRKISLRSFPYNVIYAASDEELVIVAIAHHKQKPSYWRNRLI